MIKGKVKNDTIEYLNFETIAVAKIVDFISHYLGNILIYDTEVRTYLFVGFAIFLHLPYCYCD